MTEEIRKIAKKYALQNAVKFEGKATLSAVLGKVLADAPVARKNIEGTKAAVAAVIKEVNALSPDQQKFQLAIEAPELAGEQQTKKKEELKDLPSHPLKPATFRFAPSPSGPLHVAHAYILLLNFLYAQKYKGKFILRIEDTNPDNIYPAAYEMIERDAQWLTKNSVTQIIIQSERMELYYSYALKLLESNHAYVCRCPAEEFRDMNKAKEACPCRTLSAEENLERWEAMLSTDQPGDAVVRFKTDIKHKNPAMRDFPILRINDSPHPRQGEKYRVWPLMNFAVAIDDMDLRVTHALRGKDHADNAERQKYIHAALNVPTPVAVSVGRINFTGTEVEVSCSKTRAMIEAGQFESWEDIRLPFVGALQRRGYQPEAFYKWTKELGVSTTDKSVAMEEFFKTLNAYNKEIIDPCGDRFFFIEDPVKVTITNAPSKHITMDRHPDLRKGGRTFETTTVFYLAKEDVDSFNDDEVYRLMDCLNFTRKKGEYMFHSEDYKTFKENGVKILHWLPKKEHATQVEVLLPDNTIVQGLGEDEIAQLDVGAIVQFERFGFCRLDSAEGNSYRFWYCHR